MIRLYYVFQAGQKMNTGHQLKLFSVAYQNGSLFTYGIDGIIFAHNIVTRKCFTAFSTHHRLSGGIKKIIIGPYRKYVVSLGDEGPVVCIILK